MRLKTLSPAAVSFAATSVVQIANAVNVAGYLSEGNHGWQRQNWAIDKSVVFAGDSGWYIMATDESFNGEWYNQYQNGFNTWFSSSALGGTNYSNTPVGAVCHVSEPFDLGNYPDQYYGLWQAGKTFAVCAWASRWKPQVQTIGDPFVRR